MTPELEGKLLLVYIPLAATETVPAGDNAEPL